MAMAGQGPVETVVEIARAVADGDRSAVETVRLYLQRITQLDRSLNCFLEVYDDGPIKQAQHIDQRVKRGESVGRLAGVPIAVKDNIVTSFGRTTCASRFLERYRSPFDATAVERLLKEDAIIIGKTNLDEFAMGSSTEHSAFGPTRNPWDTQRVPGGSSGGSAAAVAAGLVPAALGSDTGGSIRQPAGYCGVVGLKPTYGRVSRYGLVAYGSSLDQIGPLTRNVEDAAVLLECVGGVDRRDATSVDRAVSPLTDNLELPFDKLRIGLPKHFLSDANHQSVNDAVARAAETFREHGAELVEIELPMTDYGISTYYVIAPAEASSNLARFDGIRYGRRAEIDKDETLHDLYAKSRAEGFGEEVQRRIMLGTFVLSAGYYDQYYKRALQVRRLIKHEFDRAFEQCDVILGPVSPTPAFKIGEKTDPLAMYHNDFYTVNTNIAGHCGIALPGGFVEEDGKHRPVGVQLQAAAYDEPKLLRAAMLFEQATDYQALAPVPQATQPAT